MLADAIVCHVQLKLTAIAQQLPGEGWAGMTSYHLHHIASAAKLEVMSLLHCVILSQDFGRNSGGILQVQQHDNTYIPFLPSSSGEDSRWTVGGLRPPVSYPTKHIYTMTSNVAFNIKYASIEEQCLKELQVVHQS